MSESEAKPKSRPFAWFYEPTPGIDYNFVTGMYAAGSIICLLLYIFEQTFQHDAKKNTNELSASDQVNGDENNDNNSSIISELLNSLAGVYLVFAPFFPCLLWSLMVRRKWKGEQIQQEQSSVEKKEK